MNKIRVLYIEDDQAQRREFTKLLRAKSFTVIPAVSGETGLKLLRTRRVGVILCDLHLPGMSGLEVLKRARKILPTIPVIILTGHGSTALAVRAIKRGAYHFVLKPLDIEDIAITIHQAIEHAQLEQQLKESEAQLKRYSEQLEGTVAERTERLEYANRQLAALTEVSNRFTAIFDEDELFDAVPSLLTASLDFDRAALILGDEKQLSLRSLCFEKDSPEFIERFVRRSRKKDLPLPPHFHESMKENKTIHIPDLNADPRWPNDSSRLIRTKAIVISPIRVKGKPIGVIMGNMQHHERVMDKQDIARFEMFANMVGLAVDNIRAYHSLEEKVVEKTESLRSANRTLEEKARQLEFSTLELGKANVELLAIKETLEEKNAEMEKLLSELSRGRDELQAILDTADGAILLEDREGNVRAFNRRVLEFFDLESREVLHQPFRTVTTEIRKHFEDTTRIDALLDRLRTRPDRPGTEDFITLTHERMMILATTPPRYLSLFSVLVEDRDQHELGRAWIFSDLTKYKQAEEQLRLIVESLPIPSIISRVDDGKIIYANEHLAKLVGYTTEDLIGQLTPDFYYDVDDRKIVVQRITEDGYCKDFETRLKRSDGTYVWTIFSLVRTEFSGESVILGGILDITGRKRAEEALQKERNFVSTILETAGALVLVLDRDGRIVRFNRACEETTGYSAEEVVNRKLGETLVAPEELPTVRERLARLRAGEFPLTGEYHLQTKAGEQRLISWSTTALLDDSDQVEFIIATGLDVTEARQAQEAMQASEAKYRELVQNANSIIIRWKSDGTITFFNEFAQEFFGFSEWEVLGQNVIGTIVPEAEDTGRDLQGMIRDIGLNPERFSYNENENSRADGERVWIAWANKAIRNETGEVSEILSVGTDITARRRAEEKMRLYRKIFESSSDGIAIYDSDGKIMERNPALIRYSGYPNEELDGALVGALLGPQQADEVNRIVIRDGLFRGEVDFQVRGGISIPIDLSVFPVFDDDGRIICYVGMGRDITERKRAEEALGARLRYEEGLAGCSQSLLTEADPGDALQQALRHLLDASGADRVYIFENFEDEHGDLSMRQTCGVWADDHLEQIDDVQLKNAAYKDGLARWQEELSRGNVIGGLVESFPESERTILASHNILSVVLLSITVANTWYGFIGFDECCARREWTDEDIRTLRTGAEMIGIYLERRQVAEALRVSEERFRSLVENANNVIYSMTPEGEFTYISPQLTASTGHDPSEILGKNLDPLIHPDDMKKTNEAFQRAIQSGRRRMYMEFRMKHKDGGWRWFESHASVLRDETGAASEVIGVGHDITEMKTLLDSLATANQELRDTQTQLVQSEKMASLGMLVAGIAHEINTPVGAIGSMHDTLVRAVDKLKIQLEAQLPDGLAEGSRLATFLSAIQDANKVIKTATERVTTIVRRLRSFARLDEAELKTVNIHEGLEDTLTLIHHEIKHNIEVERNFGDIPEISCYPGRLNQVFLNILNNARQAIKGKGVIVISTQVRDGKVIITIKDNGAGIAPDALKRIFDPGFTTKGVGVGTGLGLAICYQIMQDHKGGIKVESVVGDGTTFTVWLPLDVDSAT